MSIEPITKDINADLVLTIGKKIKELRKDNNYTFTVVNIRGSFLIMVMPSGVTSAW